MVQLLYRQDPHAVWNYEFTWRAEQCVQMAGWHDHPPASCQAIEVWRPPFSTAKNPDPGTLNPSPPASWQAWPAMGVRQLPSSAVRNARSQTTASRVSSWFRAARNCAASSSPSLHAMPMAPCRRCRVKLQGRTAGAKAAVMPIWL